MNPNQIPPNKDWLAVVLVISFLGLFALAGLVGGLYLLANGKAGDANLTSLFTITATAVGALGSMLANTRQSLPPTSVTSSPATTTPSTTTAAGTTPSTTAKTDTSSGDTDNDQSNGMSGTGGGAVPGGTADTGGNTGGAGS